MRDFSSEWYVIAGIAFVSALLCFIRFTAMNFGQPISEYARVNMAVSYFVGTFVFGVAALFVYRWMTEKWVESGGNIFLAAAVVIAVVLSIAVVVVRRSVLKTTAGIPEYIILNLVWAVGFGWLMPYIMKKFP